MKDREVILQASDKEITLESKRRGGTVLVAVVVVLILLVVLGVTNFSNYLNEQLFLERQTHLLEITGKVSEIVDVVVNASWGDVKTCEQLLKDHGDVEQDTVFGNLEDMKRYMEAEDAIILAFDQKATFYSSDGHVGHWEDPSVFYESETERQVLVESMPYLSADAVYMVFLQPVKETIAIEGTDRYITHIAIARNMDLLKEAFSVPGFEGNSYTFLVNEEGRRVYRDSQLQEFIDSYNILKAMEKYEFINGGTIEDLKSAVGNEEKACLEFDYEGVSYYVGTSLVPSVKWEVMMFVPTEVLGANTNALLDRTSQYFIMIGATVLVLFLAAVLAVMTSRSDKKLMEQQRENNELLARAAEEAERANMAKSDFLSRMSHDIRTPINGIRGMTDIAIKNIGDDDKTLNCLEKIDAASGHLLSLVNDVLDMSRVESGKTALNYSPIDLREILDNCSSIVYGQASERKVEFHRQFAEFEHPTLLGDALRLKQILINILGNAVKFTPDGGNIYFSAEEIGSTEETAKFRFVIEDTGKGMKKEFLEHIFEPFSQEDEHARSSYQGTGLGMAITKQFVDLMDGDIRVESELNVGSKFIVEIAFDIYTESLLQEKKEQSDLHLTGMKVLLVEDNELNMEIAQYLLEEEGIVVIAVENGEEAVKAFEQSTPGSIDAILMDVMMPVMDGLTAAKKIRAMLKEDAATVPIIAMTANAYEEDMRKTREAGMNEHLSKPIDGSLLLYTLSRYHEPGEKSVVESTGRKKNEEETRL